MYLTDLPRVRGIKFYIPVLPTESFKLAANQIPVMAKFLFFFSLGIVFYCYIGYGILILLLVKLKHLLFKASRLVPTGSFEPEVTLVVAAFDEADFHRPENQEQPGIGLSGRQTALDFYNRRVPGQDS